LASAPELIKADVDKDVCWNLRIAVRVRCRGGVLREEVRLTSTPTFIGEPNLLVSDGVFCKWQLSDLVVYSKTFPG